MSQKQNLDLNKLIPSYLKNETLDSVVSNLFNRFLSEEQSVYVDGRIGKPVTGDAEITHENLDRSINALIPSLVVKTGTKEDIFTFDDFINKLESIGADVDNMRSWMAEQAYNYSMPISYDKLINFSNYFWVGAQKFGYAAPAWNPLLEPEFYVIEKLPGSGGNDWQKYNRWMHRDDIEADSALSINLSTQATRPIIEYVAGLEINAFVDASGNPSSSGTSLVQSKTRFNQIPQFNLYRYDGTHQGSTSGIFFYQEDPDFTVDEVLKKRVKTTTDYDYIFGIGNVDAHGRLLYYKVHATENGILKEKLLGTWRPGPANPIIISKKFTGAVDKSAALLSVIPSLISDTQQWVFTATSPTTFSCVGTKSGNVGVLTVGVSFQRDDLAATISAGPTPFAIGETFTFTVLAPSAPRYVKKLQDGSIINFPGGPTADIANEGAWLHPARVTQNLERETRPEISYGDIIGHVKSVLRAQDGFSGVTFGINNTRNLVLNPGHGGSIHEFSSNFPLLASMLMQDGISPAAIIDYAELQYNLASSSIDQFIINNLADYLSSNEAIIMPAIDAAAPEIQRLLAAFEEVRASNENLNSVYSDSTALVKNWPATAPMLGLLPAVTPKVAIEPTLEIEVIVHHDGHVSPIAVNDSTFNSILTRSIVQRSDGQMTAGVFSNMLPPQPYARQLWCNPATFSLKIFSVIDDTDNPPVGVDGDFWYKRSADELYHWDALVSAWVLSPSTMGSRWLELDAANIRNSLMLAVENKLHASVHPSQVVRIDINDVDESEEEFAKFAAKYGYDQSADIVRAVWKTSLEYGYGKLRTYFEKFPLQFLDKTWGETYVSAGNNLRVERNSLAPLPASKFLLHGERLHLINRLSSEEVQNRISANISSTKDATLTFTVVHCEDNATYLKAVATVGGLTYESDVVIPEGPNHEPLSISFDGLDGLSVSNLRIDDLGIPFSMGEQLIVDIVGGVIVAPPTVQPTQLWHFDTPSSETTTSTQGATWTIGNGVEVSTAQHQFGASSLAVDGGGDIVLPEDSSPSALKTINFSIWVPSNLSAGGVLFDINRNAGVNEMMVEFGSTSTPFIGIYASAFSRQYEFTANVWHQIAIEFDATNVNVYVDGLKVTSTPKSTMNFTGDFSWSGNLRRGGYNYNYGTPVYIDEYRIVNDAVYGSAFYVPTISPFTESAGDSAPAGSVNVLSYAHVPAVAKKLKGIGQWFTNLIRYNFIDETYSYSINAFRAWELKLAYRVGALMRPDSLVVNTNKGVLPSTAFKVVLKKSAGTESKWISGIRVQLIEMGSAKIDANGQWVPGTVQDASDWKFRIETYNAAHPIIERYVLDKNGPYETFFALNGLTTDIEWKRYTNRLSLQSTTMPVLMTGLQNVVTFIYGYIDRLEELGWKIAPDQTPVIDQSTGRTIDWQLDIEKMINQTYVGWATGDAQIINPFMDKLTIQTPTGLMGHYADLSFVDVNSSQAAYDVAGVAIPIKSLSVIRTDDQTITRSLTPIFSAHVFIDEYEHVILMNKKVSDEIDSGTIFDPFLGENINTAYLSFTRQTVTDKKPDFNGFFLDGANISRNIVSSIDNLGSVYDPSQTFGDTDTSKHALALLGYTKKDYFSSVSTSDASQFNFWRGLIQAKGTNMTVDAFVNYKKFIDATVDEYWAYKVAEYGDAREKTFPEIKINTNDVAQKFTRLQFYSNDDSSYAPLPQFTQIEKSDDERWYSIDDLGKGLKFEAQRITETVVATTAGYYRLNNIFHNGDAAGPTVATVSGNGTATIVSANLIKVTAAGTYAVSGYTWINPSKLSPIKLFDYVENDLIEQIGLWHPAIGIHAYSPLELVNITATNDPAQYNYSTKTTDNPNLRYLKPWASREVGRVWWDTSNLGYLPYYDATIFANRDSRDARWGALAEWASIDLYQWTESDVPPSEYNALALSQEGDSSIDQSIRASGKAGLKKYYSRDRIIKTRPIAWSQVTSGGMNAHPAFGPAEFVKVFASGRRLIPDTGRTIDVNLVAGRSFGAWKNGLPYGEVLIGTDIGYDIGSSTAAGTPPSWLDTVTSISATVSSIEGDVFGDRIGRISLSSVESTPAIDYSWEISTTEGGSGYADGTYLSKQLTGGSNRPVSPNALLEVTAIADIVVKNGSVSTVTITDYGDKYVAGDVLSAVLVNADEVITPAVDYSWKFGNFAGGSNYVDGLYPSIPLIGGAGSGAIADIVVQNGAVSAVTIKSFGNANNAYSVGDVLSVLAVPVDSTDASGIKQTSQAQIPYSLEVGNFAGGRNYIDGLYANIPLTGGSLFTAAITADIVVRDGSVSAVTIRPSATDLSYVVGDVLSASIPSFTTPAVPYSWEIATWRGGEKALVGRKISVPLIGGTGSGATADIIIVESGTVSTVTITDYGTGYVTGDILSCDISYLDSISPGDVVPLSIQVGAVTNYSAQVVGGGFSIPITGITNAATIANEVFKMPIIEVTAKAAAVTGKAKGAGFAISIGLVQQQEPAVYALRASDSSGYYEDVVVDSWTTQATPSKNTVVFDTFGIQVTATRNIAGTVTSADLVSVLSGPARDVFIRETVDFSTVVDLPSEPVFINDDTDPDYSSTEYEWRTWIAPTQSQLSADLASPNNSWLPYLGPEVVVTATADVIAAMKDDSLTLRSGVPINRFSSYWTNWQEMKSTKMESISNGATRVSYILGEEIDSSRLSVYVNGVQQNPSSLSIMGKTVTLVNVVPEGSIVLLLYRAYQPTDAELSFDPDVQDDVALQKQYKLDYQYTTFDVRDSSGNVSGKKYYFWVQDKSIPAVNSSMSMLQAKSILTNGPSSFALFSRLVEGSGTAAYDSCAIVGLNNIVSKDDSYKLRFLRNFTLRDDPEEMSLKNTHVEWTLIRRGQSSKIPLTLWQKLTDSVAGKDAGGNLVPSPVRVNYDDKNGTRTRFGFKPGQTFAATDLVRTSITNTILNTSLTIDIGPRSIRDFITALDFGNSASWFSDAESARATMDLIWATARPSQINEIFFSVLDDALSDNYEFSDIFKTSYITISSSTSITQSQPEQSDGIIN